MSDRQPRRLHSLFEGGPQQSELPLHRIAAVGPGRGRVDRGIEPANRALQRLGALDQRPQALRQKLYVLLIGVLQTRELDLGLLLIGLGQRHLALLDRAMEQKPGRQLHQPRGEPHAFGGIRERAIARELFGFLTSRPVEIGRSLLHQCHAVAEQVGKGL